MPLKSSLIRSFHKIKKITFSLFLAITLFLVIKYVDLLTSVKKIEVEGVDSAKVINGLSAFKNKSLILLSEKEVEKKLQNQNSLIKNILVKKIFPQRLFIWIELYQPIAVVPTNNGFLFVSEDGRILYKNQRLPATLPQIHYYQKLDYYSFQVGDFLPYKNMVTALNFLKFGLELGLKIDGVDIAGSDMILLNLGEKKIILTTAKDEKLQNYEFEKIIKQFKIEGRDFKVLDLRFNKPIIKF